MGHRWGSHWDPRCGGMDPEGYHLQRQVLSQEQDPSQDQGDYVVYWEQLLWMWERGRQHPRWMKQVQRSMSIDPTDRKDIQ